MGAAKYSILAYVGRRGDVSAGERLIIGWRM